jgi:alpha-galactosidase/6-phospho-beta-glucosidase family protein
MRALKLAIIGGGSYQWSPKLVTDLFGTASLAGSHLVLCDIDPEPLPKIEAYAGMASDALGAKASVSTTTDQRRALDGADFVVVTISTGGFESMKVDLEVPAAHGIHQSVGDTVGPGGISRSLRNVPVLVGIARDMEQLCPEAWMLNITNPMTCLTRAVCKESNLKCVGLCHEVGNFSMDLAIALGLPHTVISPVVAGVNHFPVVCSLDIDGQDGFEVLSGVIAELGGLDKVQRELYTTEAETFSRLDFVRRHLVALTFLERLGALPAAGDRHVAEFVPWVLTESSGWGKAWGIELTPISRREEHQTEYISEVEAVLSGDEELQTWPSGELVAPVIDSLITGTRRELPLNLPNEGQSLDVPPEVVVESICVVDENGIRGRDSVHAPVGLAEILRRQVAVQELTVEAATQGDRDLAVSAFLLDPLAGRGSLPDIVSMADELLEGTSRWLPEFALESKSA